MRAGVAWASWRRTYTHMTQADPSAVRVRKDLADNVVEVNTGDGWERLTPASARNMAAAYNRAVEEGSMESGEGVRRLIETLYVYADDVDET